MERRLPVCKGVLLILIVLPRLVFIITRMGHGLFGFYILATAKVTDLGQCTHSDVIVLPH